MEKEVKIYVQEKDGVSPSNVYALVDDESEFRLKAVPIENFAGEGVATITAGDSIEVDNTDPKNPIIATSAMLATWESARTVNDLADPEVLSADFAFRVLKNNSGTDTLAWNDQALMLTSGLNAYEWEAQAMPNLPTYADNAAALAGNLVANQLYKTATGEVRIVV